VFDLDDLEKEKKVVMTEARRYLDSDSSILWRAVAANLFSGTSLDRMFFGDEKTMKNITLEQFSKFYEIYKNPKNATLFIGTNSAKSKEKVVKYLNEFYKYVKNKQRFSGEKVPAYEDKFAEIVKVKNIKKGDKSQSSLRLAFRVDEKLNTKEKVAFVVLSQAMLGGLTGKLIKKLRDELALVYSVGLGMEDFKQGVGFINFATDCAKDKKNVVVSEIKKFIYNLETELTQACVDAVVPTAIYQNQRPVFVHDDLEELMEAVIYNQKYLQRKEGMEILKKIKVSDLIKLSKKLFKDKNSTSVFLN
jgi:predicted Zn-dependent peptidase